jgi:maleylpyruvate isomerase
VDPKIARALTRLGESTDRVLATADGLTDAGAAAPSRLPGWSRGHVLTHLARNADGFRNLLAWAASGDETPMYPSEEARDRGVEEGAGRPAAELAADLRVSAAAFAGAAQDLPAQAWDAPVARRGVTFPARGILPRRLSELEIHHVDLGAGYRPDDWPAGFVAAALARVAGDFAGRPDAPACLVRPDGRDAFPIGPAGPGQASPVTVSGPPAALLAWLIGRDSGAGLDVAGAATVPVLPPWR